MPRGRRPALLLALAVLPWAAPRPAPAASDWARVRSDHFEVLSNAGEAEARALAERLERFRAAMSALLVAEAPETEAPTVVLAFRDGDSFAPYRPVYEGRLQDVDGFFVGGSDASYIAVQLGTPRRDRFETAYHEYAHVFLNRMLPAQPVWVAEGLAEVLSAWEDAGADARFGLDRPEDVLLLRRDGLLPLEALLDVGWTSASYHAGADRPRFYAQSWALVHHLLTGDPVAGAVRLRTYLEAIAEGTPSLHAFVAAFGRHAPEVTRELATSVAQTTRPSIQVATRPSGAEPPVVAAEAGEADVEFRLGDLLLHAGRVRDARAHLRRAVEADPRHVRAHEALAHAALKDGRWDEADREVAAALAVSPDDAVALLRYAQATVRHAAARGEVLDDATEGRVVTLLERAVARAPHLADACDLLARMSPEPYAHRIALLAASVAARPDRTDLALTLAGLHVKQDELAAARAVLRRARDGARDDANRFLCDHLLGRLERLTRGTAVVEGTLVQLECGEGVLDFVVQGATRTVRLRAPSTTDVFVYAADGTTVERDFTCGPQRLPVAARFRPEPGARPADGTLLSLTLRPR